MSRHIMIDYDKIIRERCTKFPLITYDHCIMITSAAKALSLDDVYSHLLLTRDDLNEDEQKFVELIYNRGKTIGIKEACDNMFLQMRMRGGGQTALDYLSCQSGEFKVTAQATPKGQFNFTVVVPEIPNE